MRWREEGMAIVPTEIPTNFTRQILQAASRRTPPCCRCSSPVLSMCGLPFSVENWSLTLCLGFRALALEIALGHHGLSVDCGSRLCANSLDVLIVAWRRDFRGEEFRGEGGFRVWVLWLLWGCETRQWSNRDWLRIRYVGHALRIASRRASLQRNWNPTIAMPEEQQRSKIFNAAAGAAAGTSFLLYFSIFVCGCCKGCWNSEFLFMLSTWVLEDVIVTVLLSRAGMVLDSNCWTLIVSCRSDEDWSLGLNLFDISYCDYVLVPISWSLPLWLIECRGYCRNYCVSVRCAQDSVTGASVAYENWSTAERYSGSSVLPTFLEYSVSSFEMLDLQCRYWAQEVVVTKRGDVLMQCTLKIDRFILFI